MVLVGIGVGAVCKAFISVGFKNAVAVGIVGIAFN
jgi:hypothetical protein